MKTIQADCSLQYADLQRIIDPFLASQSITLDILRLDSLFPDMSGNKYFKLKHSIQHAVDSGCKQIVSFGGAFSNHIHALAIAGETFGLGTVGYIRGEKMSPLNETLQDAKNAGMDLHFVSRVEYRKRNNEQYLSDLQNKYPTALIIPEGGSNRFGVEGCKEIVNHIHHHLGDEYDVIVVPCGTGATLAGIAAAVENKQVWGIAVLKDSEFLEKEVKRFHTEIDCKSRNNWIIYNGFHCGGYAKINRELMAFIDNFEQENTITLEPIYSGKKFYGLYQLINKSPGIFKPKTGNKNLRVVAIHTGGLQGLRGMKNKIDKLNAAE